MREKWALAEKRKKKGTLYNFNFYFIYLFFKKYMYKKWWLQSLLNMKLIKRSLMVMQPAHSRKLEMKEW